MCWLMTTRDCRLSAGAVDSGPIDGGRDESRETSDKVALYMLAASLKSVTAGLFGTGVWAFRGIEMRDVVEISASFLLYHVNELLVKVTAGLSRVFVEVISFWKMEGLISSFRGGEGGFNVNKADLLVDQGLLLNVSDVVGRPSLGCLEFFSESTTTMSARERRRM